MHRKSIWKGCPWLWNQLIFFLLLHQVFGVPSHGQGPRYQYFSSPHTQYSFGSRFNKNQKVNKFSNDRVETHSANSARKWTYRPSTKVTNDNAVKTNEKLPFVSYFNTGANSVLPETLAKNHKWLQQYFKSQKWRKDLEEPPTIVEDDIAIDTEETLLRLGVNWSVYPKKKWRNNTVPYRISAEYQPRERSIIESALKTFEFMSCLKFEHYNGTQTDWLNIHVSKKRPGCWSYVGRRGGRQDLSLRPPDGRSCHCLCNVGRPLHEIMHALGFYHEHSRPDRDKFINIIQENVKDGKLANFNKKSYEATTAREFEYDYESIMHYGPYFFSKDKRNRKVTIQPRKFGQKIGQRIMLSSTDCMKINHQFGCFDPDDDWNNKRIQTVCGMLGFSFT